MSSLITQVKSRLFIRASKKSLHALDGAHASLLHGPGLDLEDLREYAYGDRVRDIDWRATARVGTPLVKRYRATRMHTVLFAVDAGREMAALAHDERPKRELAVLATGVLGLLTLRHGDDFTVVHGDAHRMQRRAPARSEGALEHALRAIDRAIRDSTAPSDRDALLSFIARTVSRRMIVVLITDEAPITADTERLLRRLRAQHDVLWVTIRDADPVLGRPAPSRRADVGTGWAVPGFLHGDGEVVAEQLARLRADAAHRDRILDGLEISRTVLDAQETASAALLQMLNRRADARTR